MRNSVYIKISENYTATIYSLEDLKAYCEYEGIVLTEAVFVKAETQNQELAEEIQNWISPKVEEEAPKYEKRTVNTLRRRIEKGVKLYWEIINREEEEENTEFEYSWHRQEFQKETDKIYTKYQNASKAVREYAESNNIDLEFVEEIFDELEEARDLCTTAESLFNLYFEW